MNIDDDEYSGSSVIKARIRHRIAERIERQKNSAERQKKRRRTALAGAISIVALWLVTGGNAEWKTKWRYQSFQTEVGEVKKIHLRDGSIISLNGNASIRVGVSKTAQTVKINYGEALFHIARQAGHPFTVTAGTTSVEVMGTTFNVLYPGSGSTPEVRLREGKIKVEDTVFDVRTVMYPGQRWRLRAYADPVVDQIDTLSVFNFDDKLVIWHKVTPEQIVYRMQRIFPYDIQLALPAGYRTKEYSVTFNRQIKIVSLLEILNAMTRQDSVVFKQTSIKGIY